MTSPLAASSTASATPATPATLRRVAVLGATGATGRELVRQALARGLEVVAVGRDAARLRALAPADASLRPHVAAVTDPLALAPAVAGSDAVLVALGPRKGDDPATLTTAVGHVLAAMTRHEVRRLLLVSGAGIRVAGDRKPLPDRVVSAIVRAVNRRDVVEKEAQLALVRAAGERDPTLRWTVVRPPRLVDRPGTGRPLVADAHTIRGGRMVPYADLAAWMLDEAAARRFVRQAVFVAAAPAG